MQPLVSVVIPVYNEEKNVEPLARRVDAVFAGLPEYAYECLFANDCSDDGTRAAIERMHAEIPQVRPIHLARRSGQSAAVVAAMRRSKGEFILTLDGDLQNDPCDFPRMLELLQDHDCVCGYRANRHDTWIRKVSSKIGNGAREAVLKDGIRDAGCGSKGFRRSCIEHVISFNGMHRYFAVLMRAAGKTIAECPVTHHPRQHGISKYGINNRLWRGIYDLFGVRWLKRRYVAIQVEGEE
ncbi:MAG TPA: glycosyltransferase family 2 protein [Candidatus Hydrogenedentes bacterium]|nr:glycosyltransferase family 2 protein [Candidatus Hydrogenedentota bacterium]HPG67003.1 glycosyltransferase family 2 protein [Candidatus Hydrogenedentota bacterium]